MYLGNSKTRLLLELALELLIILLVVDSNRGNGSENHGVSVFVVSGKPARESLDHRFDGELSDIPFIHDAEVVFANSFSTS